jgi:actin beta/gamma 1
VKHLYLELNSVLTFYHSNSNQLLNSLIIESGSSLTYVTPVVDGKPLYGETKKFSISGQDCSKHCSTLLNKSGYALDPIDEYRVIQHIKNEMCYVCENLSKELKLLRETPEEFKQELELGEESLVLDRQCFLTPEIMFEPSLFGMVQAESSQSLPQVIFDVAKQASQGKDSLLLKLLSNIVLGGGNLCFEGFSERLQTEIKLLAKTNSLKVQPKVIQVLVEEEEKNGSLSAITGASHACTNKINELNWLTREEYKNIGTSKFFTN